MLPELRDARLWAHPYTARRARNAYRLWSSYREAKYPSCSQCSVQVSLVRRQARQW